MQPIIMLVKLIVRLIVVLASAVFTVIMIGYSAFMRVFSEKVDHASSKLEDANSKFSAFVDSTTEKVEQFNKDVTKDAEDMIVVSESTLIPASSN